VFVGPVIDEDAVARFERAAGTARQEGRIVHGGERLTDGALANGYFVAPTIVADLPGDHWLNREELFLPFVAVNAVDSLEDGLRRGNAVTTG
jgi:1-pyrroline-5-carboxylate dehydrogenase